MKFLCNNKPEDCSKSKYRMKLIPEDKDNPICPECSHKLVAQPSFFKKIFAPIYQYRYILLPLTIISSGVGLFFALYEPPKEPEPPEPQFSISKPEDVIQGEPFEYKIKFYNVKDSLLKIDIIEKPEWIDFYDQDSSFWGEPQHLHVGKNDISIRTISGNSNKKDTTNFNLSFNVIDANDAPYLENAPNEVAEIDSFYLFKPSVIDVDGDKTTIKMLELPSWLKYDSDSGILSGTPSADLLDERDIVSIEISDKEAKVEVEWKISIIEGNQLPYFTSTPSETVDENSKYKYRIQCDDKEGDRIKIEVASLPEWLKYKKPIISGTPGKNDIGKHEVVIKIRDNVHKFPVVQNFIIEVKNVNDAPKIVNLSDDILIEEGQIKNKEIIVEDPDDGDTFTINLVKDKDWIQINNNPLQLILSPTIKDVGSHTIQLEVTDAGGASSAKSLKIDVELEKSKQALIAFNLINYSNIKKNEKYFTLNEVSDLINKINEQNLNEILYTKIAQSLKRSGSYYIVSPDIASSDGDYYFSERYIEFKYDKNSKSISDIKEMEGLKKRTYKGGFIFVLQK